MYRQLGCDVLRDLAPVSLLATGPAMLVTHPSLPVKSVKDLVALANARPGAINHASAGVGTFTLLAVELFKRRAVIDLLQVPCRSGGEALTAVLSGETSVYFAPAAGALPQVSQGRLRPAGGDRQQTPVTRASGPHHRRQRLPAIRIRSECGVDSHRTAGGNYVRSHRGGHDRRLTRHARDCVLPALLHKVPCRRVSEVRPGHHRRPIPPRRH